jgi:hypothetical protein
MQAETRSERPEGTITELLNAYWISQNTLKYVRFVLRNQDHFAKQSYKHAAGS